MTPEPENIQCPDCGSTVRPGASFCFKCGKHFELADAQEASAATDNTPLIAADAEAVTVDAKEDTVPAEADFQKTLPDMAADPTGEASVEPSVEIGAPPEAEAKAENKDKPIAIKAKPQLTPVAEIRRKPKPQREKIEMVWEQPEGTSNPVFVIGSIVIFVLVLTVIVVVYLFK